MEIYVYIFKVNFFYLYTYRMISKKKEAHFRIERNTMCMLQ